MNWALAGIIIVVLFSALAPFDMDEFNHYHPIACHFYRGNLLNTFREHCRGYDLDFLGLGWILPLRSFAYSGSISSIFYFPLFLLWPNPLSARFLGFIYLSIQAWCISRVTAVRFSIVLGGLLLFFPYAYQHFVDTGPIGFHTTSVFLLYVLMDRWTRMLQWRWILACSVIVFFAVWAKLSYGWLLPGVALIGLILLWEHKNVLVRRRGRAVGQTVGSLLLLLALSSTVFLSTAPGDRSVRPMLQQVLSSESYSFRELKDGAALNSGIVRTLMNPREGAQRAFTVSGPDAFTRWYSVLLYLFMPAWTAILLCFMPGRRRQLVKSLLLYAGFLLTLLFMVRTKSAGSMHHTVLSYSFLVFSIAMALGAIFHPREQFWKRAPVILWAAAMIVGNVVLWSSFWRQPVIPTDHPSQVQVNAMLRSPSFARNYLYVVVDWGMYYTQALYGDSAQSVIYMEPLSDQFQIDDLRRLSAETGRKLAFVYNAHSSASDIALIRSSFPVEPCSTISAEYWHVLAEPGLGDTPCSPQSATAGAWHAAGF